MPINTTVSQSTPQKGLVQPNNSGLSGLLGSIGSGISNFGSNLGKQFSGLVQLPGAMLNAGQAANIASNTQNAASGNAYIPNYGGQYSGQGITPNAAGATAKISSYPSANASSTLQTGTTKGIGSPSSLLNQNNSQSNSTSSGLVYPSPSLGLGTGGGAAPAGQEYGPTGQLQPKGTTSGLINPGTFNTNPYNASAPTYPGLVGALAGTASQPSAAFQQGNRNSSNLKTKFNNLLRIKRKLMLRMKLIRFLLSSNREGDKFCKPNIVTNRRLWLRSYRMLWDKNRREPRNRERNRAAWLVRLAWRLHRMQMLWERIVPRRENITDMVVLPEVQHRDCKQEEMLWDRLA